MLFIVSPAKKMNVVDNSFPWRDLPAFVDRAEILARAIRSLSYAEAKALWRCSDAIASLNVERFRTMDLRAGILTPAALAYEGVQYQNLAPQCMTDSQLDYLQKHLRILSGFYGVLRPLDGVMPYRLEMQAKLSLDGAHTLYEFWGDALARALAADERDVVVNLASVEYAKACVPALEQAHREGRGPRVVTCLFGTIAADGRLVQRSVAAKAARGSMVRWAAERDARDPEELRAFDVLGHRFDEERSTPERYVFVQS